ncbi:MAG: GxxExxY protein [Flavobacteriales bacterium]
MEIENNIATEIIACAIRVHRELGPGLLEKAYTECLFHELKKSGLSVEKEKTMPLIYDGIEIESGYRIDLIVENRVIIELKAIDQIIDIHVAQTLTYLKLSKCKLGLIINFNTSLLKHGIKRIINTPIGICA